MKVGIFIADSNGGYPVPASKGGAVSTLVEHLVKRNNELNILDMEIVSYFDAVAEELSKKYANIKFIWIKVPWIVRILDKLAFWGIRTCFRKKKSISYKNIFSLFYYIIKSSKIIKKTHYDKIVLENNIPMAWIIKLSNYQGEYYYHFHNVPRINAKAKKVFKDCTGFLCVSQFVKNQILSEKNPIGPINEKKVKVLYNCIDVEQFNDKYEEKRRLKKRKEYGIKQDETIVLFVGRLSEEKGIDKLLEAIKLVDKKIKVFVVGSCFHGSNLKDSYQIKLFYLAKELKNRVRFLGFIPQKKINEIYHMADIAVLPSMWDEPAGLTMVEAMACGLPVITTCSGGIPEYVGMCAIKLNADADIQKNIAKAINDIIDNKVNIKDMVSKGIKRVNEQFNSNEYLTKFCYEIGVLDEKNCD